MIQRSTSMRPTSTRVAPGHLARRRKQRVVQWVGLLAMAGLLAIATLPQHPARHADAADFTKGAPTWHG